MPVSIQRFLEEELKAEIEEWEKWNAATKALKMVRQSKKEKDARKSSSKEKVKADTKEWKFMIKQLRSELMQLKQKNKETWQPHLRRLGK